VLMEAIKIAANATAMNTDTRLMDLIY